MNTNLILSGCFTSPIAASVCNDLVLNGYSDWYLPSLGELQLMSSNLFLQGIGGFLYGFYWSSTQHNFLNAWGMGFGNVYVRDNALSNLNQVRAVRAF